MTLLHKEAEQDCPSEKNKGGFASAFTKKVLFLHLKSYLKA
jgi:hypothetical protein